MKPQRDQLDDYREPRSANCRECGFEQNAGTFRCGQCGASSPGFRERLIARSDDPECESKLLTECRIINPYAARTLTRMANGQYLLDEICWELDSVSPVGFWFGAQVNPDRKLRAYGWWLERRRCRECGEPGGRHKQSCANPKSQRVGRNH